MVVPDCADAVPVPHARVHFASRAWGRAGEGRSASEVCQTLLSESQRDAGGTLSAQAWLTATGRYAAAPRSPNDPISR